MYAPLVELYPLSPVTHLSHFSLTVFVQTFEALLACWIVSKAPILIFAKLPPYYLFAMLWAEPYASGQVNACDIFRI